MATIYPRLAIDYGQPSIFYFPPYGEDWGTTVERTIGGKTQIIDNILTDGVTLDTWRRSSVRFEIEGQIVKSSADDARTELASMLTALEGDVNNEFKFYLFHDEFWQECFVEKTNDIFIDYTRASMGLIGFRVRFTAGDPVIYDTSSVSAGPYEDDIYEGETGIVSVTKQRTSYGVVFPGEIQITSTPDEFIIVPEGDTGATLEIVSIQATCNQILGSSGSTTIRVADRTKSTPAPDYIQLSLTSSETSKRQTGSFTITAGDSLYLYCNATAGHQDLMVSVVVKG